ncbi:hypothetical protein [Haloarchaeobius sp. DYHT-AS-18]
MVSVLVALEFVVMAGAVLLFFPLEAVAPVLPLMLLFAVALFLYWK